MLTRISKTKDGTKTVESDHNILETKLSLPWNKEKKTTQEKVFNFKNENCKKVFKEATSNNTYLSEVFDDEADLDVATEKLMKRLNKTLHKCLKKVGHKKEKSNEQYEDLYSQWKRLRTKDDIESKTKLKEVEDSLADDFFDKVKDATNAIDCGEGGMS